MSGSLRSLIWLGLALCLSACAGGRAVAPPGSLAAGGATWQHTSLQCAPYARSVAGLQLSGDAADWWPQAAGRYPRGSSPQPGSVLVFRRTDRLRSGHVSVVERVVGPRQVLVTQANWVRGHLARGEPVVDVSPANDWSLVRVWWQPTGTLGITAFPTFGFIEPAG